MPPKLNKFGAVVLDTKDDVGCVVAGAAVVEVEPKLKPPKPAGLAVDAPKPKPNAGFEASVVVVAAG